jgi:hypothetical protein
VISSGVMEKLTIFINSDLYFQLVCTFLVHTLFVSRRARIDTLTTLRNNRST